MKHEEEPIIINGFAVKTDPTLRVLDHDHFCKIRDYGRAEIIKALIKEGHGKIIADLLLKGVK